jgi:hypothetical protein
MSFLNISLQKCYYSVLLIIAQSSRPAGIGDKTARPGLNTNGAADVFNVHYPEKSSSTKNPMDARKHSIPLPIAQRLLRNGGKGHHQISEDYKLDYASFSKALIYLSIQVIGGQLADWPI